VRYGIRGKINHENVFHHAEFAQQLAEFLVLGVGQVGVTGGGVFEGEQVHVRKALVLVFGTVVGAEFKETMPGMVFCKPLKASVTCLICPSVVLGLYLKTTTCRTVAFLSRTKLVRMARPGSSSTKSNGIRLFLIRRG
jgi:hypothetical protein